MPYMKANPPGYPGCLCGPAAPAVRTLTLNGRGSIRARPDIATVRMGVVTQNIELKAAQQENAAKSNQLLNALRSLGIPDRDIQTESYSVNPEYDYVDGKQVFRGYRVTNIFKVTIRDIQRAGEIIDTATANGANTISGISFEVSDPSKYYRRALNLAIEDAIGKAEDIEARFGFPIDRVPVRITEESISPAPVSEVMMLKSTADSTPVSPGQVELTAAVKAVFLYK